MRNSWLRLLVFGTAVVLALGLAAGLAAQRPSVGNGVGNAVGDAVWSADALDAEARGLSRLHSLLVSRRGELIFERYYSGIRRQTSTIK